MQELSDLNEILRKECGNRGLRLTSKRVQIMLCLMASKKSLSAYELIDLCEENYGESIPPITVYRVLEFFEEQNMVHKLQTMNKFVACAHIDCQNSHPRAQFLICSECQKVEELAISSIEIDKVEQEAKKIGFVLKKPQLEMEGVCTKCAEKKSG